MLVIENHILSYEYFCDKLQEWELLWLLQNMNYSYKNEWQMVRYQLYYAIAPYTKTRYNSIEEFLKRVKETHGTSKYAKEYFAAIEIAKVKLAI